jgi:predicted lactoylglutathione lyase
MISSIFVNLPVENLKRSVEFFTQLGFKFNPQFTDDESTCMIVNDTIYVMLLEHKKFAGFIDKPIAAKETAEAILSFSLGSPDEVRAMTSRALELGARMLKEPEDLGFMFGWGFEDLDGHLWEMFWMDPEQVL